MWMFLSNAFVSIVQPKAGGAYDPERYLMVRARLPGDLERLFPGVEVHENKGTDYRFRCFIERGRLSRYFAEEIVGIRYTNFKDSVPDKLRHDIYLSVWNVMFRAQEAQRPAKRQRRKKNQNPPLEGETPEERFWDWRDELWGRGKPQPLKLVKR